MLNVSWLAKTDGKGYWSDKSKLVHLDKVAIAYVNKEGTFGELRVYFTQGTWSVKRDGLIYTDMQFLQDLRDSLFLAGFDTSDVDYSEQGMQGEDYVSLDVGPNFLASWKLTSQVTA